MTGVLYIFQVTQVNARERENDANTMRLRSDFYGSNDKRSRLSTRKADYKGGSPCFLFSSFFKSEKGTRGGDGIPAPSSAPRAMAGTFGCRAPRPAPGNFPLVRKVTKGTAGVPPALPPLSFGSDAFDDANCVSCIVEMCLLLFISALRADKKRICKFFKSHTSTRGARNRRKHNATTSGTHSAM
jgi:hypothetical protein